MENLFAFIYRYRRFFLLIAMQLFALFLVVQNNHFHKVLFFHSSNAVSGSVKDLRNQSTQYFNLRKTNEQLLKENARLRQQVKTVYYQEVPYKPNDTLFIASNDSFPPLSDTLRIDSNKVYQYQPARIIDKSTFLPTNRLVVNKGSRDGIRQGMGVAGPNGIVGIVVKTSPYYTTVMPIIHTQFKTSVVLKEQGYMGSVEWNGKNPQIASLLNIPMHVDLQPGDTVLTSGLSNVFPPDLPVGTVQSFTPNEGTGFHQVDLALFTNFQTLSFVYFIMDSTVTTALTVE